MTARRRSGLLLLAALAGAGGVDVTPDRPLLLAVSGLTEDYLEPCGCGGQNGGGLARRTALIAGLRAAHPELRVIDVGGMGVRAERWPVTARALARMGLDYGGLSSDDLASWDALQPVVAATALPLASVVPPWREPPPGAAPAPERSRVLTAPGGWRVGLVSVAWRDASLRDLAEWGGGELRALRSEGCRPVILVSHLGRAATELLLDKLPVADRPELLLLATGSDFSQPCFTAHGVFWIPVARRGRSLSLVTVRLEGDRLRADSEQRMVLTGPVDPVVQGWVDEYYARLKAGQATPTIGATASFPPVAACAGCHAATVAAWRRHPHARAVETLERAGRDVAGCLTCHDERTRRDGLRPLAEGDRGVQCASCHDQLAAHLAHPARRPGSLAAAACLTCHTAENSPRWEQAAYWASITATCRGEAAGPPETRGVQP